MASPSPLLGPQELRDSNSLHPKPITASGPNNPFMDLMVSNFNNTSKVNDISSPHMGYTENRSATYLSAGNPCLDFLFHVVPKTPKKSIEQRLQVAWDHDALTTLKLICNLRGVCGTGKSDKEGLYTAALWLHGCHPKTLACNLESLSKFGYFKDFPEIRYRILQGFQIRSIRKSERIHGGRGRVSFSSRGLVGRKRSAATRELRVANAERRNQEEKARASLNRKKKKVSNRKIQLEESRNEKKFFVIHLS